MLRNYFITAIRNLARHKFFSIINIAGLAVSMAVVMGIIMLIADQMTYDRFNTNRERIFRINTVPLDEHGILLSAQATTTLPLREELLDHYPFVEKAVRIVRGFGNHWLQIEQNVNIPVSGYFVDPEFLDVFQLELQTGNPATALAEPNSVVLTPETARKLFGDKDPMGQTFKVGEDGPYKVTGVLKKSEHKTHIAFDALASISSINTPGRDKDLKDWYQYTAGWVYVMVQPNTPESQLTAALHAISKKHFAVLPDPETEQKIDFQAQRLTGITPGPFISNPIGPSFPWMFVWFFGGLGAIIMICSALNFVNLSVARSLTRSREIGVRKVAGARRWQLFIQFEIESVLVSLMAMCMGFLLLWLCRSAILELHFAQLLHWDFEFNYAVAGVLLIFAVATGLLSGIFPALTLSGFQPLTILNGSSGVKIFSRMGMRKALLITQFTFSLIFILTSFMVFSQLELFMHAGHGFTMDHKLVVYLEGNQSGPLKNELLKYSNIESVTAASHIPASGESRGSTYRTSQAGSDWTEISHFAVDDDYMSNMDLTLIAGRFISKDDEQTGRKVIVLNEQAVKAFHFASPQEALGQELINQSDSSRVEVIGVVKDYNHSILFERITPMGLIDDPSQFQILQVKYSGGYDQATATAAKVWAKVSPAVKSDFRDFDSEVHKIYDIFFGDILHVLEVIAGLAIIISCMGLLGMATYAIETRLKEIAIRKVLGSSMRSIIYLLSKGFLAIVVVAVMIAVPMAYFMNNLWLEQIAYHVNMSVSAMLFGVFILSLFALLTIATQTFRAAFVNVIKTLKAE